MLNELEAILPAKGCRYDPTMPVSVKATEYSRLTIAEAMVRAAKNKTISEGYRKDYNGYCEKCCCSADGQGLRFWRELTIEEVEKYHKEMLERGLKANTIRLYLVPIRQTAAWAKRRWPQQAINFCEGVRSIPAQSRGSTRISVASEF